MVQGWKGARVEGWKGAKVQRCKGAKVEKWKGGKVERWKSEREGGDGGIDSGSDGKNIWEKGKILF